MSDTRQQAHHLIDMLPPSQVHALVGLLEAMLDPVALALRNAPLDDEEETEAERQAIQQARKSRAHLGGVPHAEAMRRLGLD